MQSTETRQFSTVSKPRALTFKESALPLSCIPRPLKNNFEKKTQKTVYVSLGSEQMIFCF